MHFSSKTRKVKWKRQKKEGPSLPPSLCFTLCIWMFFLDVCKCNLYIFACLMPTEAKNAGSRRTGVIVLNHHVCVHNQTQVVYKRNKCLVFPPIYWKWVFLPHTYPNYSSPPSTFPHSSPFSPLVQTHCLSLEFSLGHQFTTHTERLTIFLWKTCPTSS